jgi:tetratricopeptide (TPR) repeat protein
MTFMYYPILHPKNPAKIHQRVILFLVFSVSLFTQSNLFADILLDQEAEDYRVKGYEEQQNGRMDRALSYYEKAISLGVKNAVLFNDMGVIYEQIGIPKKAEEYYLNSIKINPKYLPPYTNLAYFYKEKGDTRRASAYFKARYKRASATDPWKEKVRQELLQLDPDFKKQIVLEEMEVTNQQLKEKARREFALQVERAERHFTCGEQLLAEKKFEEAIAEFDRALAITPENPQIIKTRQRAFYEQNIERIKRTAQKAIEKLDAGELESAKKDFQEILATIPNDVTQKPK